MVYLSTIINVAIIQIYFFLLYCLKLGKYLEPFAESSVFHKYANMQLFMLFWTYKLFV